MWDAARRVGLEQRHSLEGKLHQRMTLFSEDHDGQGDEGEPGELLGALEAERGGDAVVLLLQ